MKLLGYDLTHINDNFYDATELFNEMNIFNIIIACEEEGFEIISIDRNRAILYKLDKNK